MRSPTRTRLTFAALTCGAALILAACSDSPAAPPLVGATASTPASASPGPSPSTTEAATPDPTPSVSTSASSTPTPTATGGGTVTKGGVATGPAADAAKKVAQTFVDGDNAATRTGNFTARDKVTASSCAWCSNKKTFVQKIYAGGGRIEGELFTKNAFTVTGPSDDVYTVVVSTTVSKYREINGAGKVTDSHGDRAGLLTLQVSASKVVSATWQPAG